ncbi:MAG: hypothetical protein AAF501_15305 [Pseudomonadota bacterium]
MSRLCPALGLLLIAGCATTTPPEPLPTTATPAPAPKPPSPTLSFEGVDGPTLSVDLAIASAEARELVRKVAVRCWLDHVIGGAALLYDERTGRMIMVSDTTDLLAMGFTSASPVATTVRLTGPVLDDLETRVRVLDTLEIAVETGETSCAV